jgi:hypothetical protein
VERREFCRSGWVFRWADGYVLDDVTLAVKGILAAPAASPFGRRGGNCCYGTMAIDSVGRRAHQIDAGQGHSYGFDLLA